MSKILLTGTSGFIGKNLSEKLCYSYDLFTPKTEELNLLEQEMIEEYLKKNNFDVVIHCANQNYTKKTDVSSYKILDGNLKMFFNLERCKKYYGKMYFCGSGAEYDMCNYKMKMDEYYFDKFIPNDPYGFSKYIMSKIANKSDNIYDLRLFGVYGKYEEWERRFISNAICKCIYDMPITIRQNVYFDYLYIDDFVEIMKWFIDNNPKNKQYNVCSGIRIDLITIAKKILTISKKKLEIIVDKPGLKMEYTGDNSRMMSEVGNIKFIPMDKSIKELYEYYSMSKNDIDLRKLVRDVKENKLAY